MVTVQFGNCCAEAYGHAGAGQRGHDVVCAAVSTLICTLAERLRRLNEADLIVKLDSGCAYVACEPSETARQAFEFALTGFECLAEDQPDYVRLIRQ